MFENITLNLIDKSDALLPILAMLLGALILGFLVGRLFKQCNITRCKSCGSETAHTNI